MPTIETLGIDRFTIAERLVLMQAILDAWWPSSRQWNCVRQEAETVEARRRTGCESRYSTELGENPVPHRGFAVSRFIVFRVCRGEADTVYTCSGKV